MYVLEDMDIPSRVSLLLFVLYLIVVYALHLEGLFHISWAMQCVCFLFRDIFDDCNDNVGGSRPECMFMLART